MGRVALERTDGRALMFEGSLVVEASTRASDGVLGSRWNEIAIYKQCVGYAVAIRYRSVIPGDPEEDLAEVCADTQALALQLRTYGPGAYFAERPTSVSEYTTQARIYSELRAAYYRLINQLLGRGDFALFPGPLASVLPGTNTRDG